MLRFTNDLPFDFGLCRQSVTVYHREGLTRQLSGVYFDGAVEDSTSAAVTERERSFLLVCPRDVTFAPGDRIVYENRDYYAKSVKKRDFLGRFSHWEVRG